ncbi:MAG: hypothetical protein U1F77_18960 [Kiritimatiellia bacterium]
MKSSLDFSPMAARLRLPTKTVPRIWEVETGRELRKFERRGEDAEDIATDYVCSAPNSRNVVPITDGAHLEVWSADRGRRDSRYHHEARGGQLLQPDELRHRQPGRHPAGFGE